MAFAIPSQVGSVGATVERVVARMQRRGAAAVSQTTGRDIRHEGGGRRHGVANQFSMMIRGAILLAVGVFVTGAVFGAIPDSNTLGGAQTEVENLTGQAFEIAPVVLIVIVAVLILQFVRNL